MTTTVTFTNGLDGLESNLINIDSKTLGGILRDFVIQGSGKNVLQAQDVIIRLQTGQTQGDDIPVIDLLEQGTSLFAALIYVNSTDRSNFSYQSVKPTLGFWTADTVAKYVFTAYFYILTQNRAVNLITEGANFIRTTIGVSDDVKAIGARLFETGMEKIPHDWIRAIKIKELQQESRNRLGLGIAGYRLMQAFLSIDPVADAPTEVTEAWKNIRDSVGRGYFYGFHTHFRSAQFITTFSSLNKTLSDLLAKWGKPEEVAAAKDRKVLAVMPTRDLRYSRYNLLTRANFQQHETDSIFD